MCLSRTKQGLDQLSQGAGRAPRVKGTSRDSDIRAETSLPNTQSEKVPGLSPPQDKSSEQGGPCPVLPGPAMSSRLLCCVALCLLGPGMSLAQLDVSVPMLREPESFFSSIRVRALFFLQLLSPSITGPVDSGVTQTPRHLVKPRGQTVTLTCSPISGHTAVSWYQQAHGQGPQFLVQYYRSEEQQRGNMSDRFSGKQLGDYSSELTASSLELQDSALYLCASSSAQPQRVTWVLCTNLPGPARSYLTADRPGRTWGPQGNAGGLGHWEYSPGLSGATEDQNFCSFALSTRSLPPYLPCMALWGARAEGRLVISLLAHSFLGRRVHRRIKIVGYMCSLADRSPGICFTNPEKEIHILEEVRK